MKRGIRIRIRVRVRVGVRRVRGGGVTSHSRSPDGGECGICGGSEFPKQQYSE